jgi:hypothetical protein
MEIKMKKLFGFALFAIFGVFLFSAEPVPAIVPMADEPEPAQVIYSKKCCDSDAVVRCYLINWTPVGNSCFCPGQGYGYAC